jgi:molybdenum cofactor guanylyltransferase
MVDMASRAPDVHLTHDASLVVLTGGRSTRMGRPKADLPVQGVTLIEWIVARLGPDFAETIVAGAPTPYGARGATALGTVSAPDLRPDAGPLAGIEAGLRAARSPYAFVIACDMPRASARLAELLLSRCLGHDAAVPQADGRAQPACAAYSKGASAAIGAYLDRGERRATEMLRHLDTVFVDAHDLAAAGIAMNELADLDTPEQYEAFIASLRA